MTNTKPTMLHSDRGSVFSVFSEEELKNMTNNSKRKVAICGRINNSGIVEVPEGATLAEIIENDRKNLEMYMEKFVDIQIEIHSKRSPLLIYLKEVNA